MTNSLLRRTATVVAIPLLCVFYLVVLAKGPEPTEEPLDFLAARIRSPGTFSRMPTIDSSSALSPQALRTWHKHEVYPQQQAWGAGLALIDEAIPHIIYTSYVGDDLKHAWYDNASWHIETIDSTGIFRYEGPFTVVADKSGHFHVGYVDSSNANLKYAHFDGSRWISETVDSMSLVNPFASSLALDQDDRPHIVYSDRTAGGYIKLAWHDGITWQYETIATDVYPLGLSMALDRGGRRHVAYTNWVHPADYDLRYMYQDSQGWQVVDVDSSGSLGRNGSLVLDQYNRPHISYSGAPSYGPIQKLRYAFFDGAKWNIEVVDDSAIVHGETQLILDELERPAIAYCAQTGLKLAQWDGTSWQEQVVHGSCSGGVSFALDRNGRSHLAYPTSVLYHAVNVTNVAQWSGLAFARYGSQSFDVFTAGGGGTGATPLTSNPSLDTTPEFDRGLSNIVFVSNRYGNPKIHRMNADGSGVTRLTQSAEGDYLPTWSLDGTRIAFYSYRDGNAEIYTMGADGTDQTRLTSNSAWDGHPTWSPDGSQIAFSSDRSGRYELWVMNADGSMQHQLSSGLDSVAYPDWAPVGDRLAFSYDANADGWFELGIINSDGTGFSHVLGVPLGHYDYLAPTWAPNGIDLAYSYVQWIEYRGNWYWVDAYIEGVDVDTNVTYPLVSSGLDWWPDWQTADISAPISWISSPEWVDTPSFEVRWGAWDPGLSGWEYFDVQFRDGPGGAWTDWFTQTTVDRAIFTGQYGHTYYFRSRARDYARNQEEYSSGPGDTSTSIYRYSLPGQVRGHRGQPVFGSAVQSSPLAMNTAFSSAGGDFTLYYQTAGSRSLDVFRHGFGPLPSMKGVPVTGVDSSPIFYLPPADDQIKDGGFEAGNMGAWSIYGEITPVITATAHTGDFAVNLGNGATPILPGAGPWSSIIEQDFVLSPTFTTTTLTLSFLYRVVEATPISDTLRVSLVGPGQTVTYTVPLTVTGWEHRWWDLAVSNGYTLTVRIEWLQGGSTRSAGVVVDEISLGSAIIGAYTVHLPVTSRFKIWGAR